MSPRSRFADVAGPRGAGALALLGAFAAAACSGDSNGVTTAPATAEVRVIQASPDAGAQQILVDGRALQGTLQYKQSLDYTQVISGDHQVTVVPAGSTTGGVTVPVTLADGANYTILVRGLASATGGNFPVVADLLPDDATPAAGRASLRFVHAAPGGPAVDVYLTAPQVGLDGATPTLSAAVYARGGSYTNELATGTYRLRLTQAGTLSVLIDLPSFIISPGAAYTAVLVGAPGLSQPLELLTFTDRVAPR